MLGEMRRDPVQFAPAVPRICSSEDSISVLPDALNVNERRIVWILFGKAVGSDQKRTGSIPDALPARQRQGLLT